MHWYSTSRASIFLIFHKIHRCWKWLAPRLHRAGLTQIHWLSKCKRSPDSNIMDYHHNATDSPSHHQKYPFGSGQDHLNIGHKNSKRKYNLEMSEVTYDATDNTIKDQDSNNDPDFKKKVVCLPQNIKRTAPSSQSIDTSRISKTSNSNSSSRQSWSTSKPGYI